MTTPSGQMTELQIQWENLIQRIDKESYLGIDLL